MVYGNVVLLILVLLLLGIFLIVKKRNPFKSILLMEVNKWNMICLIGGLVTIFCLCKVIVYLFYIAGTYHPSNIALTKDFILPLLGTPFYFLCRLAERRQATKSG